MAQIKKHAEFLETLHGMITKEATAGTASGKPGKDTDFQSVSTKHEHVDKNKVGPDGQMQEFVQEAATDASNPTKGAKKHGEGKEAVKTSEEATEVPETTKEATVAPQATSTATPAPAKEDTSTSITQAPSKQKLGEETNTKLAQLGQQLLDTINEMNKEATAGTASGKPGKDTDFQSVSTKHEHVDKNKVGPDGQAQEFKQVPATDSSNPIKGAKKHGEGKPAVKTSEELDLDKEASFELGRQFARAFLSNKTAAEGNIYKEAGRRDFEALIAQASAELEAEAPRNNLRSAPVVKQAEVQDEELQIKQAEEAGAQAFYDLVKQAEAEQQASQIKQAFEQKLNQLVQEKQAAESKATALATKLASTEATIEKAAEEAKLDAKFAQWGGRVVEEVISRLKTETTK